MDEKLLEKIQNDGLYIKNIQEEFLTHKMCLEAVKQNKEAIYEIPLEFINFRIYMAYLLHI